MNATPSNRERQAGVAAGKETNPDLTHHRPPTGRPDRHPHR
jgi:hypothetical protein